MFTIVADQFVGRPVEHVGEAVIDHYFDFQPAWDPTIEALDPGEDRSVRLGAIAHLERNLRGRVVTGECVVTAFSPRRAIEVELRLPRSSETRQVSCYPLAQGGTRVHVRISSDLRGLAALLAPLSRHVLSRGLANSLHGLRLAVESARGDG